jgi:hypothetical protein
MNARVLDDNIRKYLNEMHVCTGADAIVFMARFFDTSEEVGLCSMPSR